MEKQIFTNDVILSWLQYYSQNTTIDLEHVKIIDITKKNKNVIPTVEVRTKPLWCSPTRGLTISFTGCGTRGWASVRSGTTKAPNPADRFCTSRSRT